LFFFLSGSYLFVPQAEPLFLSIFTNSSDGKVSRPVSSIDFRLHLIHKKFGLLDDIVFSPFFLYNGPFFFCFTVGETALLHCPTAFLEGRCSIYAGIQPSCLCLKKRCIGVRIFRFFTTLLIIQFCPPFDLVFSTPPKVFFFFFYNIMIIAVVGGLLFVRTAHFQLVWILVQMLYSDRFQSCVRSGPLFYPLLGVIFYSRCSYRA